MSYQVFHFLEDKFRGTIKIKFKLTLRHFTLHTIALHLRNAK